MKVHANLSSIAQLKCPLQKMVSVDFYAANLNKHAGTSEFYSKLEYLYAGLIEAKKEVKSFVPHPFVIKLGNKTFTPSFYIDYGYEKEIHHISTKELDEYSLISLKNYFLSHHIIFKQVSPDNIISKQVLANNWLNITKHFVWAKDMYFEDEMNELYLFIERNGSCQVGDVIERSDISNKAEKDAALISLLYLQHIKAELSEQRLSLRTTLWINH